MFKKALRVLFIFSISVLSLVGCTKSASVTKQSENHDPITLRLYQTVAALCDDEFKDYIADPVHKKFPFITMEMVRDDGKDNSVKNLVASNNFPDIVFTASNFLFNVIDSNIPYDLNGLAKMYNMNLNRFNQTAIQDIKAFSDNGELLALPFSTNFSVLVYNKSIFDKFGLDYPTDGMTWEQIADLIKKLERNDGGVHYDAIDPMGVRKFSTPLSLPLVDPTTQKAIIATESWQGAFGTLKMLTDNMSEKKVGSKTLTRFLKDQNLAMFTYYGDVFGDIEKAEKSGSLQFDWDIASMPSFKEAPGIGFRSLSHDLLISSTSRYKEEAFQVIQYLTGDEVQLALTKRGIRFPAIDDQKLKDSFGSDNPILKGKHVEAIFKSHPAKNPKPTKYDSIVESQLGKAFDKVMKGTSDINTALRDAEDAANQAISDEKAGK